MAETQTKIKVYYMHHIDGLSRLSPLLLLDGGRVWQCYVKRKWSGVNMYYLFYNEDSYVKLWKDKRGNLLYSVEHIADPMFFSKEEPDVLAIDVALMDVRWDDEAIYYTVHKKIEFSTPVIGVIRKLNPWATRPFVYLLFHLFAYESPPDTSSPGAQEPSPQGAQGELSRE
jgi:hypothetical protein